MATLWRRHANASSPSVNTRSQYRYTGPINKPSEKMSDSENCVAGTKAFSVSHRCSSSEISLPHSPRSVGPSDFPSTPNNGAESMESSVVDELPPLNSLITRAGEELELSKLNQDSQAYLDSGFYHSSPTKLASSYDFFSTDVSRSRQTTTTFDALSEFIPRTISEPFSDCFPRVGLEPDPFLNAHYQQKMMYQTEYYPDSQASSTSLVDDSVLVEESAPIWPHQVPETAFGLPRTNNNSQLAPVLVSEMSKPHSMPKGLSQMPSPSSYKSKGGRRHGFRLSKDAARNARDIRQLGSCWHCYLMKTRCSPGAPCDACQGIVNRDGFRNWPLTCFRKLEELTDLFFPGALIRHLDIDAVLKFCTDNIMCTVRGDFEIRLTAGYGTPFLLDALTVVPANNSQLTHGLGIAMNEDSTASSRVWHETPFISLQLMSGLLLNQVQCWLNEILFSKLEGWPDFSCGRNCFAWQRGILRSICRFFTTQAHSMNSVEIGREEWLGRPRMLRKALEFSILIFVMGHQLLIPEDEKSRLAGELDIYIRQGTNVSCRLPNKIFKMQLLPMLKRLANDVLTELHVSLRDSKDPADWGFDFSVMILLLTVVAENQISLDDVVACAIDRGDCSRSREVDAMADIKALETSLTDMLIKLFDKKYKSRGDSFNPFQFRDLRGNIDADETTQQLVRDISSAIDQHPYSFFPWPDLDEMRPDQLYPYNVARLLSKFLRPFFETKEGQDQHRSMVVGKRHKQQPSRP